MNKDGYIITYATAGDLRYMEGDEGLILQGCGGRPDDWIVGIQNMLTEQGILQNGTGFKNIYSFKHKELTNLLFLFEDGVDIDMGKLAMWRLATHEDFHGTWLSDYVENRLGGYLENEDIETYITQKRYYFPLKAEVAIDYDLGPASDSNIIDCLDDISKALDEYQTFDNTTMLDYFDESESAKAKMLSMRWGVCEFENIPFGYVEIELYDPLTPEEENILKEWISGQNSDGLGEGFEQHEISTEYGDMYVSMWQYNDYFIKDGNELEEYLNIKVNSPAPEQNPIKPNCPLIGQDGNIFNLMGIASRTLRQNGMADEAKEMCGRITSSGSYYEALGIIGEYVNITSVDDIDDDFDEGMGGM